MLDLSSVRILAALLALSTVVAIAMLARRGAHEGGRREFRAQDNPPEVLQIVWPLINVVPQAYPFLVAALPDLFYAGAPRFAFLGDSYVQIAGFLLWGAGGLLALWSERNLGRFMMIEIAVAKDHELIESGPYARIRHPTYTGVMCLSIGVTLLFLGYALLPFAIATILIANYRARKEERLLASPQGLGQAYVAYMGRTGRFLPRSR